MNITKFQFEGFRNLKDNYILPINGVNVIFGSNAQGKTNVLEGIWLFNGSRSFRGAKDNELIGFDRDAMRLSVEFVSAQREQTAEIFISNQKKEVMLNGIKKNYVSELAGSLCFVIFSPEHLTLVKNGPAERRKFIDSAIVQIKPSFMHLSNQYNQTVNQRNALLKEIPYKRELLDTLSVWDEHMSYLGSRIILERLKYFERLKESACVYHDGISGKSEKLELLYNFSFDMDNADYNLEDIKNHLYAQIVKNRDEDLLNKYSSCGPHRDDIDININGRKAKAYASQGQQRSVVLSLKLAEASILKDVIGENPIILLDDVLSELDSMRQDYLLNNMNQGQVFVTDCDITVLGKLKEGKVFNVKNGVVKKTSL